jgi:predicted phosphodiesterase
MKKILLILAAMAMIFGVGALIALKISQTAKVPANSANNLSSSANNPAQSDNSVQDTENSSIETSLPTDIPNPTPSNSNLDATSLTFAVIGDTKSFTADNPNGNLEKAVASLSKQKFDFAFVMGDLVSSCDGGSSCEKKYTDWKSVMAPILSKTYEVQGNHDRTGGSAADTVWQKEFNLPTNGPAGYSELTYSFDFGNSHFVVLTSEKPKTNIVNDVQRNWLDADLTANKKPNTFIFLHEPAFQMSQDAKDALDAKPEERDLFWNVLKKHNVTAVFNGHLHMIARKQQDGIQQFVIGDTDSTADDIPQKNLTDFGLTGHHYALVNVNGNTTDVKIYSLDGGLENDFSFSK